MIVLTILFAFPSFTHAIIHSVFGRLRATSHQIRSLKAASDPNALQRRGNDFELYNTARIMYKDDIYSAGPKFASSVQLKGSRPILVLEHFEHHLEAIQCTSPATGPHIIDLQFISEYACSAAALAWKNLGELTLVTSHAGCNADGEREIFRVVEILEDRNKLELQASRDTWRDAMTSIHVEFGNSHAKELSVRHHVYDRRAIAQQVTTAETEETITVTQLARVAISTDASSSAAASSQGISSTASSSSLSAFPNLAIPSSSPNQSIDQPFHLNLSYQKLDQSIQIPLLPQISFGCKNCSTKGSLDVLTGSFTVDLMNVIESGDVIQNGTVMLSMPEGFNAHIELGLNVSVEAQFDIPIIDVPIQGFTIPRIGKAGLYFSPVVSVALQSSEPIQMGFGFEVEIPKNSSIELDVSELSNFTSSIVGFNDTQVKALTASLNASIAGSLTTSFQPNIVFGFELDPQQVEAQSSSLNLSAHAAAVFDAPALTFILSRETSIEGMSCAPDKDNMNTIVSSEVSFGMGVEAEIYVPGIPSDGNGTLAIGGLDVPLPSKSIPILSRVVTSTSTCVGEVKGSKTEGPVVVTSAIPPQSSAFGTPASPAGKAPSSDASILVANLCAVLLAITAMVFMSL